MQEEGQNDVVRDEDVNVWVKYVSRLNRLGNMCAVSYPNAVRSNNENENKNSKQNHHNNKNNKQSKKTKTKHLLQLITSQDSVQNTNTSSGLNKQHLISQIISNLSKCSIIDNQMIILLEGMEVTMSKWEKMRREEIAKFRINEMWGNDHRKSQVNQQAINCLEMNRRVIYGEQQNAQFQEEDIKIETYYTDSNNDDNNKQHSNTNKDIQI